MVNPLSRVAMKNIIEKASSIKDNKANPVQGKKVKTLGDFAKSKGQNNTTRNNTTRNNTTRSNDNYNKDNYGAKKMNNNMNTRADKQVNNLIKNVINGEVKIKENNSINTAMTLEQAVERTKR